MTNRDIGLNIDQMRAIVEGAPYLNQKHCYLYWDESDGTYQILPVFSIIPGSYVRVDDLRAAIAEHDAATVAEVPGYCEWAADEIAEGDWNTACGKVHYLADGRPFCHEYKYCPYCGNEIKDHGHD